MTREEAIALARKCFRKSPHIHYVESFQPNEWVIDAIMQAARPDPSSRKIYTCKNCEAVYGEIVTECDCDVGVKHGFDEWLLIKDVS